MKTLRKLILLFCAALALPSCIHEQEHRQLFVSQPEVFTRERLVDDRLQEYNWLETQLALSDSMKPTYQALSDQRLLSGFVNQLEANFAGGSVNPTTIPSVAMPTSAPSGSPVATEAQESMVDQFADKEAYRNVVKSQLRDVELDDSHDLRGRTLYNLKFDVSLIPKDTETRKAIVFLKLKAPQISGFADYRVYAQWTRALDTEFETETRNYEGRLLEDELPAGYLDWMAQQLSQGLKTYADRKPNTPDPFFVPSTTAPVSDPGLVKSFNTVVYGSETSPSDSPTQETLASSVAKFELITDSAARVNWLKLGQNVDDVNNLKLAIAFCIRLKYEATYGNYVEFSPKINCIHGPNGANYYTNSLALPPSNASDGFTNYLKLKDAAQASKDPRAIGKFNDSYKSPPPGSPGQKFESYRTDAENLLKELSNLGVPKVLNVSPAEYDENISDVSSREDFLELSLALSAQFKNISVGDQSSYLSQSIGLLNAIKRSPLEVGFECAPDTFGVLVGPKFAIGDDQKPKFLQTPVRYSFNAEIAVPGWWSSVDIQARYVWVGDDRLPSNPFECKSDKDQDVGVSAWDLGTDKDCTTVVLPSDPAAISATLGYYNDRLARGPQIEIGTSGAEGQDFTLQATTRISDDTAANAAAGAASTRPSIPGMVVNEQTLLIRGNDLWRNPKVFVGARQADSVDVLPDMHGLFAHFKSFPMPPTAPASGDVKENLTVVTTFGADSLYRYVNILPPPGGATAVSNGAFASISTPFAVAYNPNVVDTNPPDCLTFILDKATTPPLGAKELDLKLKLHDQGYAKWVSFAPNPPELAPKYPAGQIVYAISKAELIEEGVVPKDVADAPISLDVDLQMPGAAITDSPKSILAGSARNVILFFSEEQRKLVLIVPAAKAAATPNAGAPATAASMTAINFTIPGGGMPDVWKTAYPALATGFNSDAPIPPTLEFSAKEGKFTAPVSYNGESFDVASIPNGLPKVSFNLTLVIPSADGKTQTRIPIDRPFVNQ